MKRMMWILVVAGWAAAQTVTVVEIVDASRSFAPMAAESKNEQRQMVEAMPAGAHFVVLSVGNSVRRIFDGDLNPARKTEALRQIAAIPTTDFNTNLGAALEDAQASLDGLGGRRMIWIFTDGGNEPPKGSRFRGRSFEQLLGSLPLPSGTELYVRLFGSAAVSSTAPGVKALHNPPDWLTVFPPPGPPAPVRPVVGESHFRTWWVGSGIVLLSAIALAVWLWRRLPGGLDGEPVQPRQPEASRTKEITVFNLRASGGPSARLEPEGTERLVVGDLGLADLLLPDCLGGCIALTLEPSGTLQLENCGTVPVAVGSRQLQPGKRWRLPNTHLHIRIGGQDLFVFPEKVICKAEVTK